MHMNSKCILHKNIYHILQIAIRNRLHILQHCTFVELSELFRYCLFVTSILYNNVEEKLTFDI